MALRTAPARLAPAPPRLRAGAGEGHKTQPGAQWYRTARWQRLRWQVLLRDGFACALCGTVEPDTSALVADHRVPHRGDEALFWDAANLQCLCARCHDGPKRRTERGAIGTFKGGTKVPPPAPPRPATP